MNQSLGGLFTNIRIELFLIERQNKLLSMKMRKKVTSPDPIPNINMQSLSTDCSFEIKI